MSGDTGDGDGVGVGVITTAVIVLVVTGAVNSTMTLLGVGEMSTVVLSIAVVVDTEMLQHKT